MRKRDTRKARCHTPQTGAGSGPVVRSAPDLQTPTLRGSSFRRWRLGTGTLQTSLTTRRRPALESRPRTTPRRCCESEAPGWGIPTAQDSAHRRFEKSPFGSSGTPAAAVLRRVNGATASQINVAITLALAFRPMLLPRQEQAATSDLDAAVGSDVGAEIGNHPDLARGVDSSHDVPIHVRERTVCVCCPGALDTGMTPMPPSNLTRESLFAAPT